MAIIPLETLKDQVIFCTVLMILVPFSTFFYLRSMSGYLTSIWIPYALYASSQTDLKTLRKLEGSVDTWSAVGAVVSVQLLIYTIVIFKYADDIKQFFSNRGHIPYEQNPEFMRGEQVDSEGEEVVQDLMELNQRNSNTGGNQKTQPKSNQQINKGQSSKVTVKGAAEQNSSQQKQQQKQQQLNKQKQQSQPETQQTQQQQQQQEVQDQQVKKKKNKNKQKKAQEQQEILQPIKNGKITEIAQKALNDDSSWTVVNDKRNNTNAKPTKIFEDIEDNNSTDGNKAKQVQQQQEEENKKQIVDNDHVNDWEKPSKRQKQSKLRNDRKAKYD